MSIATTVISIFDWKYSLLSRQSFTYPYLVHSYVKKMYGSSRGETYRKSFFVRLSFQHRIREIKFLPL